MSFVIPIIIRLLGLFGVKMSPFMIGAALSVLALFGAGAALLAASHHGYAKAAGVCQEKALQAQIAALTTERNSLADRVARSGARISELSKAKAEHEQEADRLRNELATRPLQSTKEGAKRDPQALLDDRCGVTDGGLRRLR